MNMLKKVLNLFKAKKVRKPRSKNKKKAVESVAHFEVKTDMPETGGQIIEPKTRGRPKKAQP